MPQSHRLTLLINPIAGHGRSRDYSQAVQDTLRSAGWDLNVIHSLSGAHIEQVAAQSPAGQVIAVLSGDGGIARAAAGAWRSGAVIAPLPGGRGNDFIRTLELPRDPVTAASRLFLARERLLDVGFVNGRAFLGVASVGFDTVANQVANDVKWLRGGAVYAYGALTAIATFRPATFHLTIDGEERTVRAWNIAVGNSGRYGGGMKVCPLASLEDGLLNLVTIGAVPRTHFPRLLRDIFSGQHTLHPDVIEQTAHRIAIRTEPASALTVYADGDPLAQLPVTITVQPKAVRFLV